MSAPPYMPLYVADYLGDTRHLSTEQHGAYLLLLMAMWRAGGRLPNEAAKLARIAGLSAARWAKLEADVLELFDVRDDDIGHKRIQKEFEKYTRTSENRRASGALGGKAKALKNKETGLATAEANADQNPTNQNQNQKDISPDGDTSGSLFAPVEPKVTKRGKRISEDWTPTEADWLWAKTTEELTDAEITRATDEFKNYWLSRSRDAAKLDWSRAWRARISEIAPRIRRDRQGVAPRPRWSGGGGQGPAGFAEIAAKRRGYLPD